MENDQVEEWLKEQNEKLEVIIKKCNPFSQRQLYHYREQDIVLHLLNERKKELNRRSA